MSTIEEVLLRTDTRPTEKAAMDTAPRVEARRRRPVPLRTLLVSLDASAVGVSWLITVAVSGGFVVDASYSPTVVAVVTATFITIAGLAALAVQRLYQARVCSIRSVETVGVGRTAVCAGVAALVLPRVLPVEISTSTAAIGAVSSFTALVITRGLYRHWLRLCRQDGRFLRPVVIIGSNDEAHDIYRLLTDHPELGFRLAGVVGDAEEMTVHGIRAPHLGSLDEAHGAIVASGANGVIIAASGLPSPRLNALTRHLLQDGVHVHLSSGLRGIDQRRLRAQPLAHEPLFYLEPRSLSPWQLVAKRVIDVVVSVVGGVLFALPLVALAAIAIKLQDGGKVFYRQERVGKDGRPFSILKLRTMVPNADRMYGDLAQTMAGRDGPLIKLANDPRRTTVGRFLERLSIDELPQLLNVVKGEMSLVGPRPAQASEVAGFDEELLTRLSVPPGVTGLWQVEARDNPTFAAYRRYDLYYLENWSLVLDLAILLGTVQQVLLRGVALIVGKKAELATAQTQLVVD